MNENVTPETPNPATEQANTPVETPVAQTPAPPPKPQIDPWLARQAMELGIPQHEIEASDPASLQRTVYHLNRQAADLLRRQPSQTPQINTPEPEPEVDLGLSPVELAELQEINPVLLKAIKASAAKAAKAEKLERELQQVKQQTSGQDLARRVNAEMAKYPDAIMLGTEYESDRRDMILRQLANLEHRGVITPQTPVEYAVQVAVSSLGFAAQKKAATPQPPPPQPATPTARPTNRIGTEGEYDRDAFVAFIEQKKREAAERGKASSRNGEFVP